MYIVIMKRAGKWVIVTPLNWETNGIGTLEQANALATSLRIQYADGEYEVKSLAAV